MYLYKYIYMHMYVHVTVYVYVYVYAYTHTDVIYVFTHTGRYRETVQKDRVYPRAGAERHLKLAAAAEANSEAKMTAGSSGRPLRKSPGIEGACE